MIDRIPWPEHFMAHADLAATRSTCLRRKVGAVAVRSNRIVSTGYNGAPSGLAHCGDLGGCLREQMGVPSGQRHEICRAAHAEANVVAQAAKFGVSLSGCTVYVTCQPCSMCAKLLIQAGIIRIVYRGPYPDDMAMDMLHDAGVAVELLP
jgi:dCMP deaminase